MLFVFLFQGFAFITGHKKVDYEGKVRVSEAFIKGFG